MQFKEQVEPMDQIAMDNLVSGHSKPPFNPKSFTYESAILWIMAFLKHFSKYLGVPITFTNNKLSVERSLGKSFLWFWSLSVLFLRILAVVGASALSQTVDRFTNPLHTPLYLTFAVGFLAALFVATAGLVFHLEDVVIIWNSILKYRSQVKPPQLVVWILHLFPASMYGMVWILSIFLALNPDWMVQFRFGLTWAVAEGYLSDGWWGYYALVALCTLIDFWSIFAAVASVSFIVPLHMFFLETWPRVINELCRSSTKSASRYKSHLVWRQLQQLLVMLQIFNVGNASVIFAFKVTLLFISISCGSAMILMRFHDNFLLLVIMFYLAFVGPCAYPALYYNAFSGSAGLQRAKAELLGVARTKLGQALLERRLRSVPTKGVWVGSLRTFERESVLIFFDFVIRTIVSIVLAWRE